MHDIIQGDSAEVLKTFAEGSIDAIITDPPHAIGSGFMSADWDRERPAQAIWDECFRVLKPGGHCFVMSSERLGCVAGLYMSLRRAGFLVDETQILNWVSLTGMPKSSDVAKTADKEAFRAWLTMHREFVPCPDHNEPKDSETGERQRCVECERIFCEGNLTHHDKRKAESAAVNGMYFPPTHRAGNEKGNAHGPAYNWASAEGGVMGHEERSDACALLARLLALHWPTSPSEQRAHWEACVAEVPEEWDCSRPPGVRVKTGVREYERSPFNAKGTIKRESEVLGKPECDSAITAPSTPDAVRFDGWRGSVAPLKPFCYPILHAQKPMEGSYLDNMRAHGVGAMAIDAARVPFAHGDREDYGVDGDEGEPHVGVYQQNRKRVGYAPDAKGRTPANLLSYGDLLGDLQRYADLDAWCDALGLPEAAVELLSAGLVYVPKSSRAEKNRGLPDDYDAKRNPCAKPVALCAYLITLATREGQTVLDPFCGEAPVGVAATLLKRNFVGIELEPDFCQTARARITHAQATTETVEAVSMRQLEF